MAQAESVSVCRTMMGLPRSAGFSCCSHDAKKALRSRNSHWTGWSAAMSFIFCFIPWWTGNLQVGKHHAATAAPDRARKAAIYWAEGQGIANLLQKRYIAM